MGILSLVARYLYAIAPPVFALSVYLLVQCIAGVVRTGRQARLVSVPLAAEQAVELPEAGEVVLAMEGPILSRRPVGLEYRIVGPDGATLSSRVALFHATSSGATRATKELRVFHVTTPGRHVLRIEGLGAPRPRDDEHRMILTRPHLGASVAWVVGIVLFAALAIGSVVLFAMRVAGVVGRG